jgi:SHS2 domain-containing protein
MKKETAGYRELEHTADWELEVWGPDLASLLEQAARGMYALSGTHLQSGPRQERTIQIEAPDPESLLVKFLDELLFAGEQDNLGFDGYKIEVHENRLNAVLHSASIASQDKEIKAVTYHRMRVDQGPDGLHVKIVFDV